MPVFMILQSILMVPSVADFRDADTWVTQQRFGDVSVFAQFRVDGEAVAAKAESLRQEIATELDLKIPSAPVTLVLFDGRHAYQSFVEKHIPSGRGRRALFVHSNRQSAVYAYRSRYLDQDLRHELTHAWLRSAVDFLPLWLDEGLARYFENPAEPRDLSSIRWKARLGWKPSLSSLENIEAASDMDDADYAASWAWVSFLLHESNSTRSVLTGYLHRISRGEVPGRFSEHLEMSIPDTKARIGRFFRGATVASVTPHGADR